MRGDSPTGLLFPRHLDGLLVWIPLGGVEETASGTEGGSSGSGRGGMLTPVVGERRRVWPMKGFKSSSPSGAGGGRGLGLGLDGERLGAAAKLPPTRGTASEELGGAELGPGLLANPLLSSLAEALAASDSNCAVTKSLILRSLAALLGRLRETGRVGDDLDGEADRRLSRI